MADPITLRYLNPGLATGSNNGGTTGGTEAEKWANAWQSWTDFNNAATSITGTTDGWLVKVRGMHRGGITLGSGWVTDVTHPLVIAADTSISAASGGRHAGLWTTTAAGIDEDGNSTILFQNGANAPTHVTFRGLTVRCQTSRDANNFIYWNNTTGSALNWLIEGCIVNTGVGTYGIIHVDACPTSSILRVRNCVLTNSNFLGGIYVNHANATVYAHNVTVVKAGIGGAAGIQQAAGTLQCKNCLSIGNGSGQYAGTISGNNNGSSDASGAPGTSPQHSIPTSCFVDYTNNNFKIVTGSQPVGAGADLSGDSNLAVLDDFILGTRDAPYDIGAHEFSAAVATGLSTKALLLGVGR